jgi:hypothetical protein
MDKKITGVMTVAIFLSLLGGALIKDSIDPKSKAYECAATKKICIGYKLSESNMTCYYGNTSSKCYVYPYWQTYKESDRQSFESGTEFLCSSNGCVVK